MEGEEEGNYFANSRSVTPLSLQERAGIRRDPVKFGVFCLHDTILLSSLWVARATHSQMGMDSVQRPIILRVSFMPKHLSASPENEDKTLVPLICLY